MYSCFDRFSRFTYQQDIEFLKPILFVLKNADFSIFLPTIRDISNNDNTITYIKHN